MSSAAPLKVHETTQCPACGGEGWQAFRLGEHELRRCASCELVYAPKYADPSDLYVEGYLFGGTDFGIDVAHPVFQAYLADVAAKRMQMIEKANGGRGSFLDVGCGSGEVLAVAAERGWQAVGVEPVEQSAKHAVEVRGLDVRAALLEESGLPEKSYDVVGAFHVVEHMSDATAFLRLITRWAKPGGLVVIELPNWRSMIRRNGGEGWRHLRPLEHIAHYTPATLSATLSRAGLTPIVVRTPTFLSDTQALDHQLNDLGLGAPGRLTRLLGRSGEYKGQPRTMSRPSVAAPLRALEYAYDRAGVGEVVFAIARVPG